MDNRVTLVITENHTPRSLSNAVPPPHSKQVAKQHISEERMMAHLNSLHLSDRYCNHRLGKGKVRVSRGLRWSVGCM